MLPGSVSVERVQTGVDIFASLIARSKFVSNGLTALAILALALASAGIYGVVAFYNTQRVHEIAVRMAVGGSQNQVLGLIVRQTLSLVGLGVAMGFVLALAVVRMLASFRYDARPLDVIVYPAAGVLFCCIGLAASLPIARRAASVDPAKVLRSQ
jgi:ABC-type antimicrobial peptide transport system permease subunit